MCFVEFGKAFDRVSHKKSEVVAGNDGWLFRPPDIVVGGLMFYRDSIFFSDYLFSSVPSVVAGRNSTKTSYNICRARKLVRFENVCSKIQIGGPKPIFSTTSQLNGTAYIFGSKLDIRNRASALELWHHKGSPASSQNVINFGSRTA